MGFLKVWLRKTKIDQALMLRNLHVHHYLPLREPVLLLELTDSHNWVVTLPLITWFFDNDIHRCAGFDKKRKIREIILFVNWFSLNFRVQRKRLFFYKQLLFIEKRKKLLAFDFRRANLPSEFDFWKTKVFKKSNSLAGYPDKLFSGVFFSVIDCSFKRMPDI